MDLRSKFVYWYFDQFQLTELYRNMAAVAEESPWHRERNVATHTDMVVSQYLATVTRDWTYEDVLGAFACAFHDVGKPAACEQNGIKYKPERGHYKSFGGHEQISARMWEDWAALNFKQLVDAFEFDVFDIYRVGWIIEKHLPWGVKKADKLHNMALTSLELFPDCGSEVFTNMLIADTYGRMSDDYVEKRQKVHTWIEGFTDLAEGVMNIERHHSRQPEQPVLYMPIGASGTGKSTFIDNMRNRAQQIEETIDVFSWDALRLDWYITDAEYQMLAYDQLSTKEMYRSAFERQIADKEFNRKANQYFIEMVKTGNSLVVDNTNLSKKRRRFFVDQARNHGYHIVAVLMPIALQTVLDRQSSRVDKSVPLDAVRQHYMSLQLPEYGEVDDVWVLDNNL